MFGYAHPLSLSTRMTVVLCALVLLTAIVSAGLILRELDRQLVQSKNDELERETEVQATQFTSLVAELTRDVRVLAGTPPIQGIIRATENGGWDRRDGSALHVWKARLATIFAETLRNKPDYLQVRYIGVDDDGRELVRAERVLSGDVHVVAEDQMQQKADRDYYRQTLARGPGTLYLSPIELNREYGVIQEPRTPVLRAATPVFSEDGAPFGVVVINLAMAPSFDALTRVANPRHRYYLTNGEGAYLVHPDPARRFEFETGTSTPASSQFSVLGRALEEHLSWIFEIRNDAGQPHVVGVRVVPYGPADLDRKVGMVVTASFDDITAISRRVLQKALLAMAVMVLVAAAIGIWLARSAARPIEALAESVRVLAIGASRLDLPEGLYAEAKALAGAFDRTLRRVRRHTEALEAKNRELQQFAYIASHDLQEPVRTISSYVQLVNDEYGDSLDPMARQSLEFITESCERMRALIHGLLEYSRLGKEALPTTVSLQAVVQDVQEDMASAIKEAGATVEVGELPTMQAYEVEVRLLFQNLLSNALKFRRPDVPARVEISAKPGDDEWIFCVSDNGIGIPEAYREKVFLIFQRLHNRSAYEGMGIGLAHCNKIVALHRGRIWVDENPGGGARICFTLSNVDARAEHEP